MEKPKQCAKLCVEENENVDMKEIKTGRLGELEELKEEGLKLSDNEPVVYNINHNKKNISVTVYFGTKTLDDFYSQMYRNI